MPKTPDDEAELSAEDMLEMDDGSAPRPVTDLVATLAEDEVSLHPILTNTEFRAAQAKAHKKIEAEKRAAAMVAVEKETLEAVRGKAGLITGDPTKDELIDIYLDLYEGADHVMLSGIRYDHGRVHTVPRHIADTLREIASRGHNHQNELDGKGLAARPARQAGTLLNARTGAVSQVVH